MPVIIDVNVSLGHWPFQRFAVNTPAALARHLAREGIGAACVSAVESVLHPDPDVYDELLCRSLARHPSLHFAKTANPALAGAAGRLARWAGQPPLRAVKLYPSYHGYCLRDRCARELIGQVQRRRLPLMIQMRLEDERSHYPLMRVPPVPCPDVVALAKAFPRLRVIALCAYFGEAVALARGGPNIHVDMAFMETPDTLKTALADIPARQVLFGSHTPFLTTRSAVLKLTGANIPKPARRAIAAGNARRALRLPRAAG